MIPFATQRGNGQNLATHLQNTFDNEYVELADLRGSIARDLHGAFAEWEVQADTLTHCRNYLYSMSINPDQRQGRLTREQYMDYIDRAERRLGLDNQPRAVVFHIKGEREHCHVVWSRIDAEKRKAVQLSFDRDKLMMVTREFARDHDLRLPKGYDRQAGAEKERASRQQTQYDQHQHKASGLSREERTAAVTDAWRRSDTPQAFVNALSDLGYILATGKRPYVLVDLDGHMNALPKLIGDKQVRTNDIRTFLERDYPVDQLPSVDDARKMAADHRSARRAFEQKEKQAEKVAQLKAAQAERRRSLQTEQTALRQRQDTERKALQDRQIGERRQHRQAYLDDVRRVRAHRAAHAPHGLAAFLGRVSGVALVQRSVQRYQDRRRYEAHRAETVRIKNRQTDESAALRQRHDMQGLEMARRVRNLEKLDARERQSLTASLTRERSDLPHRREPRSPTLTHDLRPPGRPAMVQKAKNRFVHPVEIASPGSGPMEPVRTDRDPTDPVNPSYDFENAARDPDTKSRGEEGPTRERKSSHDTEKTSRRRSDDRTDGRNGDRDRGR